MALVSVTPPKEGKSHRIRRAGRGVGGGGPAGFRTNSGERRRRRGRAAGTLRPAPLPGGRPALPPGAALGGRGAPRGSSLADRGGLHLPACEPHPDPGRRRPRAPHSSSPAALPLGSQPLTARSSRSRPGARAATGAAARAGGAAASGPPLHPAKRSLPARAANGVPSSRPLATLAALHPSLPAPSAPGPLGWARLLPSPPPSRAAPSGASRLAPSPTGRRARAPGWGPSGLPGWGPGGARGRELCGGGGGRPRPQQSQPRGAAALLWK